MNTSWLTTIFRLFIILLSLHGIATAFASPDPSPLAYATDGTGESEPAESLQPCQIRSPVLRQFFDLNPIKVVKPSAHHTDEKKSFYGGWGGEPRNTSWTARGYDYGTNFTINFCDPVVEPIANVANVTKARWKSVGAFYYIGDTVYSLGDASPVLTFRGRKMTLNYTKGSYCPDDPDTPTKRDTETPSIRRRKTALFSFLCDREQTTPKVLVSFVGSPDRCSYFFEARTRAACPATNTAKQQVGPSGVFGLIFGIAILVYVVGGVVYQRAVLHQRGWRQLPNYNLWAATATFLKDVLFIFFSTCIQCVSSGNNDSKPRGHYGHMPNGHSSGSGVLSNGYAHGPSSPSLPFGSNGARAAGGGRFSRNAPGNPPVDETILIDELDEVWDD